MENENLVIASVLAVFLVIISILIGISIVTSGVVGANTSNTMAKVWVWNTEPYLTVVEIIPDPINLNPGNTTQVNCTATVWDYNGWQDINVTNATFFHTNVKYDSPNDNNNHYTVNLSNCNCSDGGESDGTNATCVCSFYVWYYADNGTWFCNMTIGDKGGNATERIHIFNSTNWGNATLNAMVAINASPLLDYGNLSVTERSTEKNVTVQNIGNMPFNVSVRTYPGTDTNGQNANLSFFCDYGNISTTYERYSLSKGTGYTSMTLITNESVETGLELPQRINDNGFGSDRNFTYWMLEVPLTVGGYCNGTLVFTASQNN